jgi:hypothetical protein
MTYERLPIKSAMKTMMRATRNYALAHGYEWSITLEQYVDIWGNKWKERRVRSYVFCRLDLTGPYSADNMTIQTRSQFATRQARAKRVSCTYLM